MHVKHIEKDAQLEPWALRGLHEIHLVNFSVGGRNNLPRSRRDRAVRITKEPEEENSQHHWHNCKSSRSGQHPKSDRHCKKSKAVEISVFYHVFDMIQAYRPLS